MKLYLRLYKTLLHLNFANLLAYRVNFTTNIVSSVSWGLFSIISIILVTGKANSMFGWRRDEILLLTAIYSVLIGVFHMLFSKNFERFSNLVYYGQLDSLLVKPIDSQFLVSFWLINYTSIFRILLGAAYTFYLLYAYHMAVSLGAVMGFISLLAIGLTLLYSVWFLCVTLTIWFPRLTNIVFFMYSVSGLTRYPQEMYRQLASYVFLFLMPITLIVTTPTKALVQRLSLAEAIMLIGFAFTLFYASRKFWKFALRYYTSASS
ncbi:hypothetical protein A3A64_01475 [Candidatus Gottesmanbacteria bacterium RIFCSPLOWO2_01_FULL_48_11]|uniref:Uncharacterized protein n=2 Tax=Candidatus Gottesmaniibacteriota TaxID=1752720 RepID=A0A0G1UNU0_9BACT|nr:MAG: hypothetical protein UY27_C0008G0012 [Candidatus Gottesmanbacteria bacterium GW2011_GWA1_48_13]OGG28448.1 MAG: hypothetical protein A3A64_01475 [Candidatus Gottesmanbacteria bacterium RIFCSPLOWO2_01_FULL_48_11]